MEKNTDSALQQVISVGYDDLVQKVKSKSVKEKQEISRALFQLSRDIFGDILESSIQGTYSKIHERIEHLFYEDFFKQSQNLIKNESSCTNLINRLRQFEVLKDIPVFDLLVIAEESQLINLNANEPFLIQNTPISGVYLLANQAKITKYDSDSPDEYRDGLFGEEECFIDEPLSSITAYSEEDCEAFYIPREKFIKLIKHIPGFKIKFYTQ